MIFARFEFSRVMIGLLLASSALLHLPETAVASGERQTLYTVPHLPGQILVKRGPGTSQDAVVQLLSAFGGTLLDSATAAQIDVIGIADDAELENAIVLLRANSGIEFAEPNYTSSLWAVPNDVNFSQQWSKDNSGVNSPSGLGNAGADLNLIDAWDSISTAPGVLIAVIDDSLDTTHVDLADNVVASGRCFASPNSARPCVNGSNDPNPVDSNDFHGTLVAGTAAARGNNAVGIAGTVWQTNVLPLKVDLSYYAIVNAIDEAIAQGADIINMSFGGPTRSQALSEAIARSEAAGILILASAGNADASNDFAAHYPSDDPAANVLSIAATDSRDRIAGFSQWGATTVHLAAPGELVRTTANDDAYATVSGTSFSAPHAAGVAALVLENTGATDYERLKAHLLHGAVNGRDAFGSVIPGQDKEAVPGRTATGRLDADKAIAGPVTGVPIVHRVAVDDVATGNGNGRLDPGETARLNVTLGNAWTDLAGVTGELSSPDGGTIVINDLAPVAFGDIGRNEQVSAGFSVTLSAAVSGNEQLFFQLDLTSATSGALPTRYFYFEVGTLKNGVTVTQSIQRFDWDEFQAFHVDVPAGATDLEIATAGNGDIDLLVRHDAPPEYLITLNAAPDTGFYYVDSSSSVSSGDGANEVVTIPNPLPGTYHVVVVNYDQQAKAYDVSANYSLPAMGEIAFSNATYEAFENDGAATITVTRSGGVGGARVSYRTADQTASAGADYSASSGTLVWDVGENGDKTFTVPLLDDQVEELTESVQLTLSDVEGATLGARNTAVLEIVDDESSESVLAFSQETYLVNENASTVTVAVSRSGASAGEVSAAFATQDGQAGAGSDYVATSGVLTWADGDTADKTITVSILDDSGVESQESFSIQLTNPQGAVIATPTVATVTISDNDVPVVTRAGGGGGTVDVLTLIALLLARFVARYRRAYKRSTTVVMP